MEISKRGYKGKVLLVDLSQEKLVEEDLEEKIAKKFLGGNGFAVHYFSRLAGNAGSDPFSPDNCVVFTTGPATGTGFPLSGKYCVATKSPLTGGFFDTYSGGSFALGMKAFYDAIAISGKASVPTYLYLSEDGPELKKADEIWGKTTINTEIYLRDLYGEKSAVTSIGQAGENLVRFACVISDQRAAGRGGAGAILGSKNFKAIVSTKEESNNPVSDPEGFKKLATEKREQMREHSLLSRYRKVGTLLLTELFNEYGALGTRNWQHHTFDDVEKISTAKFEELLVPGSLTKASCKSCTVLCGHKVKLKDGTVTKAPEYESIFALGSMCEHSDLEGVIRANHLCNDFGMDTISAGATVAFAMECTEKGIFDFGAQWGNTENVLGVLTDMAHREGHGKLLGEGSGRAAAKLGQEAMKVANHSKNCEFAGHSPWFQMIMTLAYATSTRGGSHHDARPIDYTNPDRLVPNYEDLSQRAIAVQNRTAVQDSLVVCRFVEQVFGLTLNEEYVNLVNILTGFNYDLSSLSQVGERIYTLERMINVAERIASREKDVVLPPRVIAPGCDLEEMLSEYYSQRKWTSNGEPSSEKIAELDL